MSRPRVRSAPRQPLGLRGLVAVAWRVAVVTAVLAEAVILVLAVAHRHGALLFDFHGDLYGAGPAILHGRDPYRSQYIAHLAALRRATGIRTGAFAVPVYPAPVLVATAPLSLLPFWLSGLLFTGASAVGLATGLRLLGVRDWRCIALALVSWPTLFGLYLGTLGGLLVLGLGLVWRLRARSRASAAALAGVVAAKLFPWPLLMWPLAARRRRAFLQAAAMTAVVLLVGWAVIGFAGLSGYPHMLSELSAAELGNGVSAANVLMSLGLGSRAAGVAAMVLAGGLAAVAWRIGRRSDDQGRAFGLLVMAALVASPLVWEHYLALLFVPVALLAPRLSGLWFVPALTALIPTPDTHKPTEMLFWAALQAIVASCLLWPDSRFSRFWAGRSRACGVERRSAAPRLGTQVLAASGRNN